jgi:hypothetical protein
MYCSSCGKELAGGLVFCNGCGQRVAGSDQPQIVVSEASQNFLLAGLLGLPIAGIGILIGLLSVMKKELGLPNDLIFAITMLCFFLLVISELAFLFVLWQRMKKPREIKVTTQYTPQAQIKDVDLKSLPEGYSQPIPSVTDHTTRQLDYEPVSREKK